MTTKKKVTLIVLMIAIAAAVWYFFIKGKAASGAVGIDAADIDAFNQINAAIKSESALKGSAGYIVTAAIAQCNALGDSFIAGNTFHKVGGAFSKSGCLLLSYEQLLGDPKNDSINKSIAEQNLHSKIFGIFVRYKEAKEQAAFLTA